MTSTSFNVGRHMDRNSSRVLKPPGGGHTSLFGEGEAKVINPRPKYDQQNSSNLNFCLNSTDPNVLVEQKKQDSSTPPTTAQQQKPAEQKPAAASAPVQPRDEPQQQRRVPPGGFSSGGFW